MQEEVLRRDNDRDYVLENIIVRGGGGNGLGRIQRRELYEFVKLHINRSIFYVSTTFILTNNNWTTCFDCYSVILRSLSKVVSYRDNNVRTLLSL